MDKLNVGIITFQWYDNFGTLFQAFALQEALVGLGFNAYIIPIEVPKDRGLRRFLAKSPKGIIWKFRKFIEQNGFGYERGFERFRRILFRRGEYKPIPFKEVLNRRFDDDILVFGSDNIWSVGSLPIDYFGFRVFFGDGIRHDKKIVYAASTAGYLEAHRYYPQIIERIRNGGFRKISCRESCTVATLAKHDIDSLCVPDPVFLMKRDFWNKYAETTLKREYVLGYDIGHNGDVGIADLCFALQGDRDVCLPYPKQFARFRRNAVFPTPQEWLGLIKNARLVITNSFHGVAFSLMFNRDFMYVPISGNSKSLNMRAFELLRELDLECRVVASLDSAVELMNTHGIDWDKVNGKIANMRESGLSYLKDMPQY